MAKTSIILYLWMLQGSLGYPSGAPANSCETMGPPGHGGVAQIVDPPYTITMRPEYYTCGENITVALRTKSGHFRGFLCQARTDVNDYSTTVGTLTQFGTRVIMNQNCGYGRALTHSEKVDKSIVEFNWLPFENYGKVYFICTIVQAKEYYWVKERLAEATHSKSGSCPKPSDINMQISTKFEISTITASASILASESTKSVTPSTSVSTSALAKSVTPSTSVSTAALAKSVSPSAGTRTTDSKTRNQTNNSSSVVLSSSSPSAIFYLYNNGTNIQSISTPGIVGGMNSKRSKKFCRNSAEYIRAYEWLVLHSIYFLL